MRRLQFETRALHAGQDPDPASGAVVPPLSLSTTFAQEGVGGHRGFEYSRSGNPTRTAFETCVASLDSVLSVRLSTATVPSSWRRPVGRISA